MKKLANKKQEKDVNQGKGTTVQSSPEQNVTEELPAKVLFSGQPRIELKLTEQFTSLQINRETTAAQTLQNESNGLSSISITKTFDNANGLETKNVEKAAQEEKFNAFDSKDVNCGYIAEIPSKNVNDSIVETTSPLNNEEYENGRNDDDSEESDDDEDAEESDDDAFFNQLFVGSEPKMQYVSAPIDSFPCNDDSDDGTDSSIAMVKFFISKNSSLIVAEYESKEYSIGSLDLTIEEYSYLKMVKEISVELPISLHNISIDQNMLNIRRINEHRVSANSKQTTDLWDILKLVRVHFSTTEPFLAKYENELYFVGERLFIL